VNNIAKPVFKTTSDQGGLLKVNALNNAPAVHNPKAIFTHILFQKESLFSLEFSLPNMNIMNAVKANVNTKLDTKFIGIL
jgi:hypothetical protein